MDVENVLARADAHIYSDFDDTNGGLYTTWLVSNSDEPLTRKERIVFLPTPK